MTSTIRALTDEGSYKISDRGTYFHPKTNRQLAGKIENLIKSGRKVTIFWGDPKTGQNTAADEQITGVVERAKGTLKFPVLTWETCLSPMRLNEQNIVGIMTRPGVWLYQHPRLSLSGWETRLEQHVTKKSTYHAALYHHGKVFSRHLQLRHAERLKEMMYATAE